MKVISCGTLQLLEAAHTDVRNLDKFHLTDEQRDVIVDYAQRYEKICTLIADGVITVVHADHTHREEIA